jgi:hypothetical protein
LEPRPLPALLLAAALATAAPPAFAGEPAAAEDDGGPGVYRGDEKLMDVSGGFEVGGRAVTGSEGRFDQDLNLDPGVRLFAARLRGDGLVDGLAVRTFSADLTGVGDPYTAFDLRAHLPDSYRLHVRADRDAAVFRGGYDPHPFDTVRGTALARLDLHAGRDLEFHLSTERRTRKGDATLDQIYRRDRTLPVAADIRYDGRFHSVGFDATPGPFRFGATGTLGRALDESFRTLDRPDSPVRDRGVFRTRSEFRSSEVSGRAGVSLLDGLLDLGAFAGYSGAETDATLRERAVVVLDGTDGRFGTPDDELWSTETRGVTDAHTRARWVRGEALARIGRDGEVLARWEGRDASSNGAADMRYRDQMPPFSAPTDPFFLRPFRTTVEDRQARGLLEGRWRVSKAWRLRAGGERIEERYRSVAPDADAWDPVTNAALAGFDWSPSDRVDLTVLGRASRTRGPSTAISAEDAEALSARLRLRRPDGWRLTAFSRLRSRDRSDSDGEATVDAYGLAFGREAGSDGWFELSVTRHEFDLATDTRFVVDLANGPNKVDRRVRYDEEVTAATLDFSVPLHGALRAFASARAALADGDLPYRQHDAAAGLGWRFVPSTEIRLEGRRVAYREDDRSPDDYGATLVTLSLLWEF